jgi:HEAT repeat protein
MKLLDKNKGGFARYCPTFAKAFRAIAEKARKLKTKSLIKSLGSKNWRIRRYSEAVLKEIAVEERIKDKRPLQELSESFNTLEELTKTLENKNLQIYAAKVLEKIADEGLDITIAIIPLINLLGDKNIKVSEFAARALRSSAENEESRKATLKALIDALGSRNVGMRANAAEVFGMITDHGVDIGIAVAPLIKALDDEESVVRECAAIALKDAAFSGVDVKLAIVPLLNALSEDNERVRDCIGDALESINMHSLVHEKKAEIAGVIMDIINSDWFIEGAQENNTRYQQTVVILDQVTQKVGQAA